MRNEQRKQTEHSNVSNEKKNLPEITAASGSKMNPPECLNKNNENMKTGEYFQTEIDSEILATDELNRSLEERIREADGLEADKYIMQFCRASLSRNQIIYLMNRFGSVRTAYNAEKDELAGISELSPEAVGRFLSVRDATDVDEEWERIREWGIGFVSFIDADYPERFENIQDPPVGIFVKGRLPRGRTPAIAIVGSRECSNYGKEVAIDMSKKLARAGIDIISGMAAGIDGFAHRGALNGGGETYAVLGCGVDICYPRENSDIYVRIQRNGGIISEYYPGTQPISFNFPRRNRLISALADGVLVVEARVRSGSWITVDFGLEQGKDIYAVPGRIDDRLSIGCNNLIRNGAKAVTRAEDIIEDLAPRYLRVNSAEKVKKNKEDKSGYLASIDSPDDSQRKVYECLSLTGCSVEQICAGCGLSAETVLRMLTLLEIRGLCVKLGNDGYARKTRE